MMKVRVTEKHIRNGVPGEPCTCPVALAIRDVLPGVNVIVGASMYFLDQEMHPWSDAIGRFVRAFDAGKPVEPFTFILDTAKEGMTADTQRKASES